MTAPPTPLRMIVGEILLERDYQSAEYSPEHDDRHSNSDWIALLTRHVGLAVNDGGEDAKDRFRKQMVRVAALSIAAIQACDRKDSPQKEIDQTHRGSGV